MISPVQKPSKQVSPVLEEHFRFLLWLLPALERFPRSQRFLLGDRIQTLGQEVLECLIEANYSRERRHHLARANMALDKLRYCIRMAVELRHLDHRRYEFAARSIDEIGRQIGGWMKASHAEAPR
jgi:hypothetical protein